MLSGRRPAGRPERGAAAARAARPRPRPARRGALWSRGQRRRRWPPRATAAADAAAASGWRRQLSTGELSPEQAEELAELVAVARANRPPASLRRRVLSLPPRGDAPRERLPGSTRTGARATAPARGQQHRLQRAPHARPSPPAAPGFPARRARGSSARAPRCAHRRTPCRRSTLAGAASTTRVRTVRPSPSGPRILTVPPRAGPPPGGPLERQHLDEAVRQQPVVLEVGEEGEHSLRRCGDDALGRDARRARAHSTRSSASSSSTTSPPSRTSASRVIGRRAHRDDRDRRRPRGASPPAARRPDTPRARCRRRAAGPRRRTARGPPPSPARAASRRTARRRASPARRTSQRATPSSSNIPPRCSSGIAGLAVPARAGLDRAVHLDHAAASRPCGAACRCSA